MASIKRFVILFLSLLIVNIIIVGATLAEPILIGGSDAIDTSWKVEDPDIGGILVSRNGQVQYGDSLILYIPKSNCNSLENLFTFYTAVGNPGIEKLKSQQLFIQLNDNDIKADVRFIYPFLMGHSVWLSLGIFDIDEFADNLQQYEIFEVIIQNSTNFVATEYFDIEMNYWHLNGLKSALSQGKNLCLSSIS